MTAVFQAEGKVGQGVCYDLSFSHAGLVNSLGNAVPQITLCHWFQCSWDVGVAHPHEKQGCKNRVVGCCTPKHSVGLPVCIRNLALITDSFKGDPEQRNSEPY